MPAKRKRLLALGLLLVAGIALPAITARTTGERRVVSASELLGVTGGAGGVARSTVLYEIRFGSYGGSGSLAYGTGVPEELISDWVSTGSYLVSSPGLTPDQIRSMFDRAGEPHAKIPLGVLRRNYCFGGNIPGGQLVAAYDPESGDLVMMTTHDR